jgi:NAD(P) transhydrogenase subunit alpha
MCALVLVAGVGLAQADVGAADVPPVPGETAEASPMGDAAAMGLLFFVFVLAIFLGVELISKVPSQLHTPLMSGSNAISGISVVGALIAAGKGEGTAMVVLGTLAVALAMINVVGGYLVTDRMLGMFKHKG